MYFLQGTCHCEIWLVTSADSNIDRSEHCFLFPPLSTYQASVTITVHCEIGCQGADDGVREAQVAGELEAIMSRAAFLSPVAEPSRLQAELQSRESDRV